MAAPAPSTSVRVAIVGGGVSGLAAAQRLMRVLPGAELRLFEASDRFGGPLHTVRTADSVLELGADSFLIKTPWALDLCRELGLADQLVPTNEQHRRALVLHRGETAAVPEGFVLMRANSLGAMLRSPLLSRSGKLRLLAEPLVRRAPGIANSEYDESVASFAIRRLGREAYERLVQPLVAGIFVADARRLSLAATYPEFLEAERDHGSLWRSTRTQKPTADDRQFGSQLLEDSRKATAARYGQFVTLRRGMRSIVEAIAESLPDDAVQLRTPVKSVSPDAHGGWRVAAGQFQPELFDGVILATSAPVAAYLSKQFDPQLTGLLERIEYASSAVVTLEYDRHKIGHPLDGFGVVVPAIENRQVIAASFLTVKFPHTSPAGRTVVRVFMGGALHPELVDRKDDQLAALAKRELADWLQVHGEPIEVHVIRWRQSMPQYHVGHLQLVSAIEARVAVHHGLQLAGSGYRGVGIPQCVRSGREAAERLAAHLTKRSAQPLRPA